jgi:ribosomal protein S18 acetylase RimI-like enzyme
MAISEPFIRPIEQGDFERVAELTNEYFPHMSMTPSKISWRLSLGYCYFVAVIDGEVVGFTDIRLGVKRAKLVGMAVKKRFRGRGVGGALIRKALEFAMENGKKMLYLRVRRDNLAAINFYKRHGFILKTEPEGTDKISYILYRRFET